MKADSSASTAARLPEVHGDPADLAVDRREILASDGEFSGEFGRALRIPSRARGVVDGALLAHAQEGQCFALQGFRIGLR